MILSNNMHINKHIYNQLNKMSFEQVPRTNSRYFSKHDTVVQLLVELISHLFQS